MKFLFAAVPQWYPVSPYLAGALLAGQLNNAGFQAETYDFNVEFFNDILTKEYMEKCLGSAKQFLADEKAMLPSGNFSDDINAKRTKTAQVRKKIIDDYFKFDGDNIINTVEELEYSMKVLKTKELFYDAEKLAEYMYVFSDKSDLLKQIKSFSANDFVIKQQKNAEFLKDKDEVTQYGRFKSKLS